MNKLNIAILTAMDVELAPIIIELDLRRVGQNFVGELDDIHITATVAGVGKQRAVDAANRLCTTCNPALMILAGFAGGLDPFLQPGYVCGPRRVILISGESIELPGEGDRTMLTVDKPITSAQMKQSLYKKYSADAVDMESFHVAKEAVKLGCELMIIKTISDGADQNIPPWALGLVDDNGRTNMWAGVWAALSHPRRIDVLFRLRRGAKEAANSLGVSVAGQLARWVASQG